MELKTSTLTYYMKNDLCNSSSHSCSEAGEKDYWQVHFFFCLTAPGPNKLISVSASEGTLNHSMETNHQLDRQIKKVLQCFLHNRVLVRVEKPVKFNQTLQLSSETHTNEIVLGVLEATQTEKKIHL